MVQRVVDAVSDQIEDSLGFINTLQHPSHSDTGTYNIQSFVEHNIINSRVYLLSTAYSASSIGMALVPRHHCAIPMGKVFLLLPIVDLL